MGEGLNYKSQNTRKILSQRLITVIKFNHSAFQNNLRETQRRRRRLLFDRKYSFVKYVHSVTQLDSLVPLKPYGYTALDDDGQNCVIQSQHNVN